MKADRSGDESLEPADELCGLVVCLASGSFCVSCLRAVYLLIFHAPLRKTSVHSFAELLKTATCSQKTRLCAGFDSGRLRRG